MNLSFILLNFVNMFKKYGQIGKKLLLSTNHVTVDELTQFLKEQGR